MRAQIDVIRTRSRVINEQLEILNYIDENEIAAAVYADLIEFENNLWQDDDNIREMAKKLKTEDLIVWW